MLRMFYEFIVASAIFFAVTCWGSGLKVADNNRLNKLIRRAGDVVGEELDTNDCGREEDAVQASVHLGKCHTPSL